ncbi:NADH-quinone oxidoreductase subunit C [Desulfonatronovibrio hydrogenovorans]|uniref:NADH-quinone oxidoreductase subunit C n=1 Tax=Desulfonatronovibrio hydrogenovorans TaxID=53245 RepID=UPI00068F6189|nr:NADH-quinone oxidoreductase subunit C [Desulfonatronovibrio hydrogenovorans]
MAAVNPDLMEACCGLGGQSNTGYRENLFLAPDDLTDAAAKIRDSGFFLEDVSCLDMKEGFQVVYHFDRYDKPGRICLRVMISRSNPEISSIASIFPGADWHERECYDFFGITFKGHPNLIPLLLDPDHDGPPPLIKTEAKRKDMFQLFPGWTGTPVQPDSEEFAQAISKTSTTP